MGWGDNIISGCHVTVLLGILHHVMPPSPCPTPKCSQDCQVQAWKLQGKILKGPQKAACSKKGKVTEVQRREAPEDWHGFSQPTMIGLIKP